MLKEEREEEDRKEKEKMGVLEIKKEDII